MRRILMSQRPSGRRGVRNPVKDANVPLPETLTDEVIAAIEAVPNPGRKLRYLRKVFLEKFVSSDTDPAETRAQRAIEKWLAVERVNEETNLRLQHLPDVFHILPGVTWERFVMHARGLIRRVIGDTVPTEVLHGSFSGGATTTRSRTESHPALKYLGQAGITSAAKVWFELSMAESPLWASFRSELLLKEERGNVLFTVPKSTTIDRCACKEPDLNMYLQKGAGRVIRNSLRRWGIDLNDQSVNRQLAREGSLTGNLATLDLSSASDSVSFGLVDLLLPPRWRLYLGQLRSPETFVNGEWHKNHMFSSMGNGFTFELESLLFFALARTVRDLLGYSGVVSVYGDDLIVESAYALDLSWVLGVCGFSVNMKKSFWTGPFRESCGGHFFEGRDVTPFFIRRPISRIRDAIILANQIRKWSIIPDVRMLDDELEPVWLLLKSVIPPELWGGDNLESDSQLVSDDPPTKRLMQLSVRRNTGDGGYLLWLNTCGDSTKVREDPMISSERSTASAVYVSRRIKAERRRPTHVFLAET
jgi:hypothetical protein